MWMGFGTRITNIYSFWPAKLCEARNCPLKLSETCPYSFRRLHCYENSNMRGNDKADFNEIWQQPMEGHTKEGVQIW